MAKPSKLYSFSSLLMAFLFAYSTAVQFNDPDWYFWIPLYGCACTVNLLNWVVFSKTISYVAKATLVLGIYLFFKVLADDYSNGFLSLDFSERLVREKVGSGLVVSSMSLQLMVRSKNVFPRDVACGMAMLVAFGYGLSFLFFVVHKGQIEF